MNVKFYKYQGTGNDFILIDDRQLTFPANDFDLVAKLCNRKFGIGADGLILLQPHEKLSYYMKYYNSDGNESSMCGNGGRCLAAFALHLNLVEQSHTFLATDGEHQVQFTMDENNQLLVHLKMKDVLNIETRANHAFVLNTGSPHYVQFQAEPVSVTNLVEFGKSVRYNDEFKQHGINVNIVQPEGLHHIHMRTYERGVEDETLSCGTGVTAAALSAAVLNHLPNGHHTIHVNTPGGNLSVRFKINTAENKFEEVWLTGPAVKVYEGVVEI